MTWALAGIAISKLVAEQPTKIAARTRRSDTLRMLLFTAPAPILPIAIGQIGGGSQLGMVTDGNPGNGYFGWIMCSGRTMASILRSLEDPL